MNRFTVKTPDSVLKATGRKTANDNHFVFDSLSDLVAHAPALGAGSRYYSGGFSGMPGETACNLCLTGRHDLVPMSDKYLSAFEDGAFSTVSRRWIDDVAGAIPNVPAFLAGVPTSMRRRAKCADSAYAPIAIVADIALSAGFSPEQVAKRGAAILALVRVLSAVRPVELWITAGQGASDGGCYITTRIETAPLDVSVAAFPIMDSCFFRTIHMGIAEAQVGYTGEWPYGAGMGKKYCPHMAEILAPALSHVSETLFIEPMHLQDPLAKNPEAWLRETLTKLVPVAA